MRYRIGTCIVSLGLAGVLCAAVPCSATENVAAVNRSADDNWILDTAPNSPYYPPTTNLRPVEVYTAGEVNAMFQGVNTRIEAMSHSSALIDQKVQSAESRLRDELKKSLDALPQRMLSSAEMNAFRESILAELRKELALLRQDLQKQLDEIKPRK